MQSEFSKSILKDSDYDLIVFDPKDIEDLINHMVVKEILGKETFYVEFIEFSQ
jgi:hypothetical protein